MTTFFTRLTRLAAALLLGVCALSSCSEYEFEYLYKDLPFEMAKVQRPQIPAREINTEDFGGVGDGVTLNTEAFAKAYAAKDIIAMAQLLARNLILRCLCPPCLAECSCCCATISRK